MVDAARSFELATNSPPPSIGLCEDILFVIFDHFDTSNASDRADCARCARVCNLWSEPALRTLWKSLKSGFLPLYWILLPEPTGAWIKRRNSSRAQALDNFFQTLGYVGPAEQAELVEYFSKVRILHKYNPAGVLLELIIDSIGRRYYTRLHLPIQVPGSDSSVTVPVSNTSIIGRASTANSPSSMP